jgi:hypothetical protein
MMGVQSRIESAGFSTPPAIFSGLISQSINQSINQSNPPVESVTHAHTI